jgi:pimeloyl-ACP methyl ester carboxylesterase
LDWSVLRGFLTIIGLLALVAVSFLLVPLSRPPELASIRAGATAIDQSGMPDISRFQARDGTSLAYRLYPAADGGTQNISIIIHGSAGHSASMNEIAERLAAENILVVSPDIRGHGGSGTRGDIAYDGQLDDDLEDLLTELRRQYPQAHFALLGFSAGGGFALRVASGRLSSDFDRLVLLSPFLGPSALSTRSPEGTARWADVDVPRIIVLRIFHQLGFQCCESLPVIAFAVAPGLEKYVTSEYSYRLINNFTAPSDLSAALNRLKMPTTIIAGGADELMQSDKYADIVRGMQFADQCKNRAQPRSYGHVARSGRDRPDQRRLQGRMICSSTPNQRR